MKKEVIVIIAVCIVVTIITAFITTNLTGNVVSVGWWNKHQVYTVDEVDELIEDLNTGDTPIYYTKSEIDNLLKTLASGETVVINNNNTYTKTQIDSKLSQVKEESKEDVFDSFNQCDFIYDDIDTSAFTGASSCEDACKNTNTPNCLLGEAYFSSTGGESNGLNIPCNQNLANLDNLFNDDTIHFYDVSCVCCS